MAASKFRKFSSPILAALAGAALLSSPALAQPAGMPATSSAPPGQTRRLLRQDRVAFLGGELSAPSSQAPSEIARGFLAARPDMLAGVPAENLILDRSAALGSGHILRYKQLHAGLEVLGSDTVVRIDDSGRVRWAGSGARPVRPDFPVAPVLTAREALTLVGDRTGYDSALVAGLDPDLATRLVIFSRPTMDEPRLAYHVELPWDMQRMQKIRAYVDAETGHVLVAENMIRSQGLPTCPTDSSFLAYVYESNPVESTALSCVSLSAYLDQGATALANDDVQVVNCIDNNGCRVDGDNRVHFCDSQVTAGLNLDGHFTDHVFTGDLEDEDAFAEVQMFYHVNKAYEKARSLGGFISTDAKPLMAMVNFRTPSFEPASFCSDNMPSYTGGEALQPFDNAVFVPAGALFTMLGFPEEDAIIFGQGTGGDFAYDGDVIYHEFGHAVMNAVSPDLPSVFLDRFGLNSMPGGMHEGYADLMTVFLTDDPQIGEYAARGLNPDDTEIRNLENDATCPDSLYGESHLDSLPLTGAIWEARQAVAVTPADKERFDQAVFAAQQGFGIFDDFETAATRTVAEVEITMGPSAAATVQTIFEDRGLLGRDGGAACDNRVVNGKLTRPFMLLPGTDRFISLELVPAPLQFRYELDEDASEITLEIGLAASDGPLFGPGEDVMPNMDLVLRKGTGPIQWSETAAGGIGGNYTHEAEVEFRPAPGQPEGIQSATATIKGEFGSGVYHLQLVNQGPSWQVAQVQVSHVSDGGGCGCEVSPRDDQRGALVGLVLLGIAILALRSQRVWRRVTRGSRVA